MRNQTLDLYAIRDKLREEYRQELGRDRSRIPEITRALSVVTMAALRVENLLNKRKES